MPKVIQQTVVFSATPHDVYEALMDSQKHEQFTGQKANISREVGGRFTAYGGDIAGENLQLEADTKIIQAWRPSMDGWPEDHYSTVTFALEEIDGGARLDFAQNDVPDVCFDIIDEGWTKYYWEKMREAFGW